MGMETQEPVDIRDAVRQSKKIADAVIHVSRAMKDLEDGDLNSHAIEVLLQASTKESRATIRNVLAGLRTLEQLYVRQEKPKEKT